MISLRTKLPTAAYQHTHPSPPITDHTPPTTIPASFSDLQEPLIPLATVSGAFSSQLSQPQPIASYRYTPRTYPQQFSSSSPSSPTIHFQSPVNAGKAGRRGNRIRKHKIDKLIPRFIRLLALAAAVREEDNILLCYHRVWKGVRTSGRMIHQVQWEKGSATHVPFNSSSTHHSSSTSQHGATSKSQKDV